MQDSALAPFGWYPDPADPARLRWWDGEAWTELTEFPRPELQPAAGYSTHLGRHAAAPTAVTASTT